MLYCNCVLNCKLRNTESIFGLAHLCWIDKFYFIFPINWAYSSRAQGDWEVSSCTCLLLFQVGLEAGTDPVSTSEPGAAWLHCPLSVTPGHLLLFLAKLLPPQETVIGVPALGPQTLHVISCHLWTQQVKWGDGCDDLHHGHCNCSFKLSSHIDWGWIEGESADPRKEPPKVILARDRDLLVKGGGLTVLTSNGLYYFAEHLNLQY